MKKQSITLILIAAIIIIGGAFFITSQNELQDTSQSQKKIGFIYIGPPGDHGWTYMHDQGRQYMESELGDSISTTFIENVPENADAVRAIRKLAESGHDLIFTTSFNYMDQTLEVAKDFPDVKFEHATGYKRADNVSTYSSRFYEGRTIIGHIAGKMTKSNTIGYIASFPIPEVIRGINSFYLAASKVNPDVNIKIIWAYTWYDPAKEADAANTLINQGADIIVQHTDTFAPCQAAEKAGVLAFGQASNQEQFCPNAHMTAIEDVWGPYYAERGKAIVDGSWSSIDTWGGMKEGHVVMSPYNKNILPEDIIAEAKAMEASIIDGSLHPFQGPIYNQAGELVIPAGSVADDGMLASMMFYVEGINDSVPQ
ncbi:MAG: BMP family ABC transporter substrate-binding protein [Pelagibacteraceae bacterium]|nr:BMP family ABC transporter substrate-binding protein [Pelagibacteraceae bacterium]